MSLTHFPHGISSFGIPVIGTGSSEIPFTLGSYFFVDNSHSLTADTPNGGTKEQPFATLDYAIGKCSAGDVIIVGSAHAENVASAGAIAVDVAGISIVGIGNGLYRPTFSLTAAAASVTVSAANVTIKNLIFNAKFADVVTCFTVSAKDCRIEGCLFKEDATDLNWLSCILTSTTDNGADGLTIINNERISVDAAALAFISILGNCNRLKVIGNFDSQSSAADVGHFIIMAAKVCLGAQIIGNVLNLNGDNNAQTVGIFATGSSTTSTGTMAYNLCGSLDTTTELIVTAGLDFQQFQNFYTGTIAASGKLWPAVDGA